MQTCAKWRGPRGPAAPSSKAHARPSWSAPPLSVCVCQYMSHRQSRYMYFSASLSMTGTARINVCFDGKFQCSFERLIPQLCARVTVCFNIVCECLFHEHCQFDWSSQCQLQQQARYRFTVSKCLYDISCQHVCFNSNMCVDVAVWSSICFSSTVGMGLDDRGHISK